MPPLPPLKIVHRPNLFDERGGQISLMKEEAKKKIDCGAEEIFSLALWHRRSMFGLYLLLPASPES